MDEFEKLMAMVEGQAEDALRKCARDADMQDPRKAAHIKDLMKIMHYSESMMGGTSQAYPTYSRDGDWRVEGTIGRSRDDGYTSRGRMRRGMTMQDHLDAMASEAMTPQEREMVERFRKEMQR